MRDFSHVRIWIRSIDLADAIVLATSDASWSNAEDLGSQAGYMTLLGHKDLLNGKWAPISPMRWKSYKLERKTQSTLGAELMSAARAVAEANWVRSLIAEARFPHYQLQSDQTLREQVQLVVAVDNKPVYDHVHGDGIVVRVQASNTTLRWVDTRQMIVDIMTKLNVNPDFLLHVLKNGEYVLVEEGKALEWRRAEKTLKKKPASS